MEIKVERNVDVKQIRSVKQKKEQNVQEDMLYVVGKQEKKEKLKEEISGKQEEDQDGTLTSGEERGT